MVKKMAMTDWRAMKCHHKRAPLVLVFSFFVGISWAPLVIPCCAMLAMIYSINAFAVEEKGELDKLYLTLPISRSAIVSGRFALSLMLGFCGMAAGIPIMLLTNCFGNSHFFYPASWNIFILAISFLAFALCNLAMYPVLFWFGYSKGKIWGFYLPLLGIGSLYGVFRAILLKEENETLLISVIEFSGTHLRMVSAGITLLAVIVLVISFILSKHLYQKRDF